MFYPYKIAISNSKIIKYPCAVKVFIATFILAFGFCSYGQSVKKKVPSYFGFQYKQVFPTKFIGEKTLILQEEGYTNTTTQKMGFLFGATVRVGITKLIAIETGLDFTQRNFLIDFEVPDSGLYQQRDLRFIEYSLPINALTYIQLSDQWFMNASIGFAATFKPTDVRVFGQQVTHFFDHRGIAQSKVGLDLNGNLGFELRTEKNGFFYVGGSARVPFFPIFTVLSSYNYEGYSAGTQGDVDGSYFSLDLKYFFPNINSKKTFVDGPIE